MPLFEEAIQTALVADSTLTDLLSTYSTFTGSEVAAIFAFDPIPENAELPYVVISGRIAAVEFTDDKGALADQTGQEVIVDVRCYTAGPTSTVGRLEDVTLVNQIADRVRVVLHRAVFAIVGLTHIDTDVGGPVIVDTEDAMGRVLSVRLFYAST